MQRPLFRALAMTGLLLFVAACGSATSPTPTQPPAGTSSPASVAPLPTPAPSATATSVPTATPGQSAAATLAGTWNGTWQDVTPDQASGKFVLTWTQSGNALTGNIAVGGTPCLTVATVTGTVNGTTISFGAVSGTHTVVYNGVVNGTTMQGTYIAPSACVDAHGNWTATKG